MRSSARPRWYVFTIATFIFIVAAVAREGAQSHTWQPLNVKPGLWESARTRTTTMGAQSRANKQTETDKSCVTKADLQNPPKLANDVRCTWTILESTGTKASANATCQMEGAELTGTGEFEAPDQEHMNISVHLTTTSAGFKVTTDATIKSKWLGSSCGATK